MKRFNKKNFTLNGYTINDNDALDVLVRAANNFLKYCGSLDDLDEDRWMNAVEYLMETHAFSYKKIDAAFDAVRDIFRDIDTRNSIDFIDFENDAMCELNNRLENATDIIKSAERDIERTEDNDIIAEAADRAYNALTTIKGAVNNFLNKMSDYTDCDFCVEDATGEHYIDTPCITIDWADFDIADTFMDWLGYVLKGRKNAEGLSNTLYNYIAC